MNTCAAIAALAGAVSVVQGGDLIVGAPHEAAVVQVCYYNSIRENSIGGSFSMTVNGHEIRGRVRVTGGPEYITIDVPDGMIILPDAYDFPVDDGDAAVFLVWPGVS